MSQKEPQQKQSYGCGVYAVANSLFIPSFVTNDRIEASKNGNSMFQLNDWLKEDGVPFRIETYFFDMENADPLRLGNVFESEKDDDAVYCALIQVKKTIESKWHLVAAEITNKGDLLIKDSYNTENIRCTWSSILNHYHKVVGLFFFDGHINHREKAIVVFK